MAEQITLDSYKKAYRDIVMEQNRLGWYIHAIVYAIVNAWLIAINLIYVPSVIWFVWPLGGWGVGLAAHYLGAIRFGTTDIERREAQAEYRARSYSASLPR